VCVVRDVTEQRRLERDIMHAQQLESLGALAGCIAHHFNNLLSAILSNTSMAQQRSRDPEVQHMLEDAAKATQRAAGLARQLLTCAKGGAPIRTPVALADILTDSTTFVLRGLPICLDLNIAEDLLPVNVDPDQIGQVMQNLAINAAQAMPDGGTVHITADNVVLPATLGADLAPGRYVRVRVTDHGVGIPEENLARIFSPFFTTKPAGHGLGLASAHSIVRKHDGRLEVSSTVGEGTTFTVYLPSCYGEEPETAESAERCAYNGKILVMDDNQDVRRALVRILSFLGFEAEESEEGRQAFDRISQAQRSGVPFGAVILDVTVPGGVEWLDVLPDLRAVSPELRAIASSGHSATEVMANHQAHGIDAILPKPFTLGEVKRVIGSVLSVPRAC